MVGFFNSSETFSLAAIQALQIDANNIYILNNPVNDNDIYSLPVTPFDVTDYGLVGDGIANDTTALETLANNTNITNWYFPAGSTFRLYGINVPNHVDTIWGGGTLKTIDNGTSDSRGCFHLITLPITHLLFNDIHFTYDSGYTPLADPSSLGAITVGNSAPNGNIEIRNCTFTGNDVSSQNGLKLVGDWAKGGLTNMWIHNNNFIKIPTAGIEVLGREYPTGNGSPDDRSIANINIYNNLFDATGANNLGHKDGWHCAISYSAARGGSKCYNNRFINHRWDVEISDAKDVELYYNYSTGTTEYFVFYNGHNLQYPAAPNPVHHNHFEGADTGDGCLNGINIANRMPLGDIYENYIKNGPISQQDGEGGIIHDNTIVKDLTLTSIWSGSAAILGYLSGNADNTVQFYANDVYGYGNSANVITFQTQVTADVSVTNNNVYSSSTGCIQTGTSAILTNNICWTNYSGSIPTEHTGAGLSDPLNIGIEFDENITTFIHPGIYHTHEELVTVRATTENDTYLKVKNSSIASNNVTPPTANFECGSYNSGDEDTCNAWFIDSRSADYWAVRAYTEQNSTYAATAVAQIDAWAVAMQTYSCTGSNIPLLRAWALYYVARSIDLLIHNDFGYVYPATELARAEAYMDNELYTNSIALRQIGNNWTSAGMAANQAYWICKHGLATNDTDRSTAVAEYKTWAEWNANIAECYMYLSSDGAKPIKFDHPDVYSDFYIYGAELWKLSNLASCFVGQDGLIGEYWRDMWHVALGIEYIGCCFEMSQIQGYRDDWTIHATRVRSAIEVFFAALNKAHIGETRGYYMVPCSQAWVLNEADPTYSEPKIGSSVDRNESAYGASYLKRGRERGWSMPQMEENFATLGFVDDMGTGKAVFDYTFKGIDI